MHKVGLIKGLHLKLRKSRKCACLLTGFNRGDGMHDGWKTMVEICIFHIVYSKMLKKGKKRKKQDDCCKIQQKMCLLILQQNSGPGFFPRKTVFYVFRGKNMISDTKSYEKIWKTIFPLLLVVFQSLHKQHVFGCVNIQQKIMGCFIIGPTATNKLLQCNAYSLKAWYIKIKS